MNEPRLLLALFNGAWQSVAVCLLAYAVMRCSRRLNATSVHNVWNVLLCVSLALPVANYIVTKPAQSVHAPPISTAPVSSHHIAQRTTNLAPSAQPARTLSETWFDAELWGLRHARSFLLIAGILALFRLWLLLRDLYAMFALRRRVRMIDAPVSIAHGGRKAAFALTDDLQSPCVLGFIRPMIVLPTRVLETDSPEQLREVVLHEAAHVKRFDDFQNFLHRFIAAILFFDPGVMLALRELALTREAACDDAVLAHEDRIAYASTLSAMALWSRHHSIAVPALIFGKKQLVRRIEHLLDKRRDHSLNHMLPVLGFASFTVALMAVALVHFQVPAVAQAISAVHNRIANAVSHVKVKVSRPHLASPSELLAAAESAAAPAPAPTRPPTHWATPHLKVPTLHAVTRLKVAYLRKEAHTATTVARLVEPVLQRAPVASPAAPSTVASDGAAKTDLLDALDRSGYRALSTDDLIMVKTHGVSVCLIEETGRLLSPRPSVQELVTLADNGVSCNYLRGIAQYGLGTLAPRDVIVLAQQGVRPEFMAVASRNLRNINVDDAVRLAQHGVSAAFIAGIAQRKYAASVTDFVQLADHGVSLSYIDAINKYRNARAPLDDIVRLHDAGYSTLR
ncbi:MAG: M56 family metallopeptidase [Candidatus Eremiobacteraeota bacterium]|nr:M56 family metallopeptidase [Candidatus Eremiobacteraeota bacterium]